MMRAMRIPLSVLAMSLVVACKGSAPVDGAASASAAASTASAPPVVASSAPPVVATVSAVAPAASASAAAAENGPPAWLHLAPGERFKERNKEPTCVTIVVKGMEEQRCQPMEPPPATVDDLAIPHARDCPPGFGVSGSRFCSRLCKTNADCHQKHKCESGQCVGAS